MAAVNARLVGSRPSGRAPAWLTALALTLVGCEGPTAGIPHSVIEPPATSGSLPDVATDPASGDVVMSWIGPEDGRSEIFVARWDGSAWSEPARVTGPGDSVYVNAETSPRIVATPELVMVVWANVIPGGEAWPKAHLRSATSRDGGRSWGTSVSVNGSSVHQVGSRKFHGVVASSDGSVWAAWLDERERPSDATDMDDDHVRVYASRTSDGVVWEQNARSSDLQACSCCRLGLAERNGRVVAAWRGVLPGSVRDPVVAALGGDDTPTRIGEDNWVFGGCPHAGPEVAFDEAGGLHAAWYTGREGAAGVKYAYAAPGPGSFAFGTPVEIDVRDQLAAAHARVVPTGSNGAVVVHERPPGGRGIVLARVVDETVVGRSVFETESAPQYVEAASAPGNAVLVAWSEDQSGSVIRTIVVEGH